MLGTLDDAQIEDVLRKCVVGRVDHAADHDTLARLMCKPEARSR